MQPAQKGITPPGTLAFSKGLYSNKEKYANDKYVGTLLLDKGVEANDAFAKERLSRHKKAGGDPKHSPAKDGDKAKGQDGKVKEWAKGKWVVKFKTKDPVVVRDAKKNKIDPATLRVAGGDLVRFAWGENIQTKEGQWNGVALYLNGVQLLEKRAADADFDEYEGGFDVNEYAGADEGAGKEKEKEEGDDFDF